MRAQESAQGERQEETWRTAGLQLRCRRDGSIGGIQAGGRAVPLVPAQGGFEVAEYSGADHAAHVLQPTTHASAQGLQFAYDGGKLSLAVDVQDAGGCLRFHGKLKDSSGRDRALIVSFTLPVNAWGWTWWDDPDRTRAVAHGEQYASWSFLGEKRDIPTSRLPFAALTDAHGGTGLALAVPMHHPRVFRTSYSTERGLRVEFGLGLSPATAKFPGKADFTFILYACDPVWGLRSAAEKYYDFFPELFTKRVPRDGASIWRGDAPMPDPSDLEKYGVGFVWTPSGPPRLDPEFIEYVKKNRLLAIRHREPWARWHLVYPLPGQPWYTQFPTRRVDLSGVPPQPSVEQEMEMLREEPRMRASVRDGNDQIPGPVRDVAQATLNCLTYDEHDRPRFTLWHKWTQGWHSQIPLNTDPDIPEPNRATMARLYQFPNVAGWGDPDSGVANAVSWDSMTDWTGFNLEDFRRDNFKYLDEPLAFHYGTGRLMTLCGFHDFEMAQQWCREARAKGGYIMSNTESQAMLYCGQFLDAAGYERSPDDVTDEEMLTIRCLMGQKPCFLYRRGGEDGMRKMLAYGIFLSSAPLEGQGEEGGRQEGYRQLYLKYSRRSIMLSAAGWHPVTRASAIPGRPANDYVNGTPLRRIEVNGQTYYRSADDTLEAPNGQFRMERFGDGTNGLYFTLRNASSFDQAIVQIDLKALGLAGKTVSPTELVEGRPLMWDVHDDQMRIALGISRGETLILSLGHAQGRT